jgi:hypothetical protein
MTTRSTYSQMLPMKGRRVIHEDCGGDIEVKVVDFITDNDGWLPAEYVFDAECRDHGNDESVVASLITDDEDAALADYLACFDRMYPTPTTTA